MGILLKRTVLLCAAANLALLAGCSAPVDKNATYQNLDDLISAVESAGLECEGELQEFGDGSGSYRTCGMNGWAGIYGSLAKVEQTVEHQLLNDGMASVMLVGTNWIVRAPLGDVQAVQEKLGGTITEK